MIISKDKKKTKNKELDRTRKLAQLEKTMVTLVFPQRGYHLFIT